MKPVLSKKKSRFLDNSAIKNKIITKNKLMDNAGKLSAQFFLEKIKNPFNVKVLVLAGKGDNGGDAIIMHHYLLTYGVNSKLYMFNKSHPKSLINQYKISNNNIVNTIEDVNQYDWFVDGIFGIGLNREIKDPYKKIINLIKNKNVISLDIPSGIDCDSGLPISDSYVGANYVLCMGTYKNASIINEGKKTFKNTYILDIGLPFPDKAETFLVDKGLIKNIIKKDNPLRNKYHQSCSVIVGSEKYSGAGLLSLSAALNTGAGYIKNIIPGKLLDIYSLILESINFPIGKKAYLSISDYDDIIQSDIIYKKSPILIGPGMGDKKSTVKLISKLLQYLSNKDNSLVLDASGFTPIYEGYKISSLPKKCILTPHLGEFSKIFPNVNINNPIKACMEVKDKLDSRVLILKGASSIIISSKRDCYILNNGNSLLASAGSGDALSGIILGFLSKGYNIDHASILAVYTQGLISQIYSNSVSSSSMPPSKMIEKIPTALNDLFS